LRFDLNLRSVVREQMQALTQEMQAWQVQTGIDELEVDHIRCNICCFAHSTSMSDLQIAGVDGSGDFPMLNYADSFVYLSVAQATVYVADKVSGLREQSPTPDTVIHFAWIPENTTEGPIALDKAHAQLAGLPLLEVIKNSDYRLLKSRITGKKQTPEILVKGLIRPHASDTGNLAIQLRTTAEMGSALRLIESEHCPNYLLMDTTFSLPLVGSTVGSLFYEHLKRLCCVTARKRGIGFFTLSKSHGLPAMETLETLAREVQGLAQGQVAEHWYLRIPELHKDNWSLSLAEGRRIPPPGAVSYLLRFHRTTPVLRLDMDREYWEQYVQGDNEVETRENERKIFEDLDYASHDQRVYGYPYPIKAAHDRASLTDAERVALRKQLIAEAIASGMSPSLFRDSSQATGHR
jgi:hypothetical protein